MATSNKKQKHWYLQRFCAMIFPKKRSFWTIFGVWNLPRQRGGGTPPPPFHILNFVIFTKSKTWQLLELNRSLIFSRYLRCFLHVPKFLPKKSNIKNDQKITKKTISWWCLAFLGSRPLPQTDPSQGPFLTVFAMFYAHRALFKNEPFFCLGGGGNNASPYS